MAAAARALAEGGLVAFPTETVYGLGADATNPAAIARLYQAKGRPAFNPLIAHVGDLAAAQQIAPFRRRRDGAGRGVLAGAADAGAAEDQGLRGGRSRHRRASTPSRSGCPPTRWRATSCARFGGPVVAPSANLSGHVSPTTAAHVQSDLAGRIDLIVDGGPVAVGVESTIVGCFEHADAAAPRRRCRAARSSACSAARWRSRPTDADSDSGQPLAPGMLASHYAPRTRVRLNADTVEPGEALLAFGSGRGAGR